MRKFKIGAGILLSAFLTMAGTANASVVVFTDRAAFLTAIGGPVLTEDFNSIAGGTSIDNASVDLGAFSLILAGPNFGGEIDIFSPASQQDIDGTNTVSVESKLGASLLFNFVSGIRAWGADFKSLNDSERRTDVKVAGETLLLPIEPVSGTLTFYGFISDSLFTEIEFEGVINDTYGLDNVAFSSTVSAVPVPAALPLFGTGLAVMGFVGWRRKRTMTAKS